MSMHRGGHPIQRAEPLLCPSPARTTAKTGPAVDAQRRWFRPRTSRHGENTTQEGGVGIRFEKQLPIAERAPAQSSANSLGTGTPAAH